MKAFPYIIALLLLSACIRDSQLRPVNPYDFFHDNTSKVWLIDHLYQNNQDHAPLSVEYKEVIIFHANRNCYIHRLKDIGEKKGRKANFSLDIAKNELELDFAQANWKFRIVELGHEKIKLRPLPGSKFPYTMVLIPLPEF